MKFIHSQNWLKNTQRDNVLIGLIRTQYYTYNLIYTIDRNRGKRDGSAGNSVATIHDNLSVIHGPYMLGEHLCRMCAFIHHSRPSATILFVSCLKKKKVSCSKPTNIYNSFLFYTKILNTLRTHPVGVYRRSPTEYAAHSIPLVETPTLHLPVRPPASRGISMFSCSLFMPGPGTTLA